MKRPRSVQIYLTGNNGPGGAYRGKYGKRKLNSWAENISKWRKSGLDVFCYFDNDEEGYAADDALTLRKMLDNQ
jgi:uncharacterized protein YecE (DUF72 family)